MFLLREPSAEVVARFIAAQANLSFSYPEVGATQTIAPHGYTVDHNRIRLGEGEQTYSRALSALQTWKQFELGWVTVVPPQTILQVDAVVAVKAYTLGLWSLNACRVVYMIEGKADVKAAFGFAYGTLPDHVECGEERFTVEWLSDNSVWYDIYAFSRPQHPFAKVGSRVARILQKQFARESLAAIAML